MYRTGSPEGFAIRVPVSREYSLAKIPTRLVARQRENHHETSPKEIAIAGIEKHTASHPAY